MRRIKPERNFEIPQIRKILFVCHGNICRSPMAEFIMKDMVARRGLAHMYEIASAGTSTEELGNDMHPNAKKKLDEMGIPYGPRRAVQLTREDNSYYDYIIYMDAQNIKNAAKIFGPGTSQTYTMLMNYTYWTRDIADPWYTGDYDAAFEDIDLGCRAMFLKFLTEDHKKTRYYKIIEYNEAELEA